jgi:hypothetical protein
MSQRPRFKVATCTGYPISPVGQRSGPSRGLTASVLDTFNCHREVKRFRSEDRLPMVPPWGLGVDGALAAAQEHADRLNAEHA